jgi:hypothetical protein
MCLWGNGDVNATQAIKEVILDAYQEFQQTSGWLQDMLVRYRSHLRRGKRIDQHNVYTQFCSCGT